MPRTAEFVVSFLRSWMQFQIFKSVGFTCLSTLSLLPLFIIMQFKSGYNETTRLLSSRSLLLASTMEIPRSVKERVYTPKQYCRISRMLQPTHCLSEGSWWRLCRVAIMSVAIMVGPTARGSTRMDITKTNCSRGSWTYSETKMLTMSLAHLVILM